MRPLALEPSADNLLGSSGCLPATAKRIYFGRIQEIDAAFGSRVEDGGALRLVALKSEGHGAETESGHAEASPAKFCVVHALSLAPSLQDAESRFPTEI